MVFGFCCRCCILDKRRWKPRAKGQQRGIKRLSWSWVKSKMVACSKTSGAEGSVFLSREENCKGMDEVFIRGVKSDSDRNSGSPELGLALTLAHAMTRPVHSFFGTHGGVDWVGFGPGTYEVNEAQLWNASQETLHYLAFSRIKN